ncbi:hypothetical protein SOVF_083510 [Spinacia oleracea]|nr:hypothetical protein SOVF_083510 [Spinacia oleracea]
MEEVIEKQGVIKADAVILAVGISSLQEIIQRSSALCTREEFQKVLNLACIYTLSVNFHLYRKINILNACNACSGFDALSGWTFYNLNAIYQEHENDETTILRADFVPISTMEVTGSRIGTGCRLLTKICFCKSRPPSISWGPVD